MLWAKFFSYYNKFVGQLYIFGKIMLFHVSNFNFTSIVHSKILAPEPKSKE
jgi:hypothetical protein